MGEPLRYLATEIKQNLAAYEAKIKQDPQMNKLGKPVKHLGAQFECLPEVGSRRIRDAARDNRGHSVFGGGRVSGGRLSQIS